MGRLVVGREGGSVDYGDIRPCLRALRHHHHRPDDHHYHHLDHHMIIIFIFYKLFYLFIMGTSDPVCAP